MDLNESIVYKTMLFIFLERSSKRRSLKNEKPLVFNIMLNMEQVLIFQHST